MERNPERPNMQLGSWFFAFEFCEGSGKHSGCMKAGIFYSS
jgi:hypothetical protein